MRSIMEHFKTVDTHFTSKGRGSAVVGQYRDKMSNAIVLSIEVLPAYKRLGIGAALVSDILNWSRVNNLDYIEAIPLGTTEAQAFWHKMAKLHQGYVGKWTVYFPLTLKGKLKVWWQLFWYK